MKFMCVFLLSLFLAWPGHANVDEPYQSCHTPHELEEQCSGYAFQIVKPMMAYFEIVNQETAKNGVEIENRNNEIEQLKAEESVLHMEVTQLKREIISKDKVIKLLEDKDDSNSELIEFFKQHLQNLTKSIEVQSGNYCAKQILEIRELNKKIKSNTERVVKCVSDLNSNKKVIAGNDNKLLQLETEVENQKKQIDQLKKSNEQQTSFIKQLKAIANNYRIELYQKEINAATELKIKKVESDLKQKTVKNCGAIGAYQVHFANDSPFDILCNSEIAGPGWTVIQQRIRGGVDFYRDWATYRNGFGDFWDGDFFLGLEKIHRITSERPHELYIYMQRFDGSSFFARYDEFEVSGADDKYKVKKLGQFFGNTSDRFGIVKDARFSTYDNGNTDCAKVYHYAWWSRRCHDSNLNGIYYKTEVQDPNGIYWERYKSLKQVKMMIRPKAVSK